MGKKSYSGKKYYSTTREYRKKSTNHPIFKQVWRFITWITRNYKVAGVPIEDPEGISIFVANHVKAVGPVVMFTSFKRDMRPWVMNDICYMKTFPKFARMDFWHPKNAFSKAIFWLFSYLLAPVAAFLFSGIEGIPAYFDRRVMTTIYKSVQTLREGKDIVLFPENRTPFSVYSEDFSGGFVYVAKRLYKETGKRAKFYPVYISKKHGTIFIEEPIQYDPHKDFTAHKEEIRVYLRDRVVKKAEELKDPPEYELETKAPVL